MLKENFEYITSSNLFFLSFHDKELYLRNALEAVLILYIHRYASNASFEQLQTTLSFATSDARDYVYRRLKEAYPKRGIYTVGKIDIEKLFSMPLVISEINNS